MYFKSPNHQAKKNKSIIFYCRILTIRILFFVSKIYKDNIDENELKGILNEFFKTTLILITFAKYIRSLCLQEAYKLSSSNAT